MRLKRLEVFGFKSFFDKTVITFQKGITGIVGPNGCGKSNFADAILWVLGEQSPKSLRGERMEDIIFSGTDQRKALSVAEVTLTIGDITNELPPPYTPYAELTFSRRLYRSGESEYLINKNPCRLKDIRDLLIDIGAGYHAHTIIEQGKVDDIITASPMQRREIVEEAAGIAKYRLRKAEALRKLDATERNLTRVTDIIGEIKRQRNALDRQAKKAEKVQEMSAILKTLDLQVAHHEWTTWKNEQAELEREEAELQAQSDNRSSQLNRLETDYAGNKLQMTEKEQGLSELGRELAEVEKNIQRWEGKLETLHVQQQEWREARARTDQDILSLKTALAALEKEGCILDEEAAGIAKTLPEAETALAEHDKLTRQVEEAVLDLSTDLERCKVSLFDLSAQITTSKNNLVHFETRKDGLLKQQERLRLEQETIEEKLEQSERALQGFKTAEQKNAEQLALLKTARRDTVSHLEKTEEAIQNKEEQLQSLKEASVDVKARVASHEGFYRGFLNKREGTENPLLQLEGLKGMVADLIEVPPAYELALEAVLETKLRGIVVENHAEIQKGIRYLREAELGRGTFFPRRPRAAKNKNIRSLATEAFEGMIGLARDLVSVRPGDDAVADALLGGIVIMKDLEALFKAWEGMPEVALWVTLKGEVVDGFGVVSGGEQGKKGLLGQKRELQHLSDQAEKLQNEADACQVDIVRLQESVESARQKIAHISEEIRALDLEQLKVQNEQKTLTYEVERLKGERETVLFEQEEGLNEQETLIASEEAEHRRIAEAHAEQAKKETALETLKQTLHEKREQLAALSETVVQLRMKSNSLKEQQRHLFEKQARLLREKETLAGRINEKHALEGVLQEKLSAGKIEEAEAETAISALSEERLTCEKALRDARESHAALLSHMQEEEQQMASLRSKFNQIHEMLQEKALKKVTVSMQCQKVEESVLSRYQIEIADVEDADSEMPIEAAREEAGRLREKIEGMGPVNLAAIEEYKELDARFRFLSTQEEDLTRSIESLREAISKINKTTRGLFVDTFHTLNQKFSEMFSSFFGGGTAELVLLDEAHPLESGIEMMAQPPGKGRRSLLLLSGGEKALTAISLLFATFLIHPTPFCLLDEIDAPLDEENTRRFSQALIKMSGQTQFIIVTHNRFTMEIADVLYGVTMEETGISKLVSVNLSTPSDENETASTVAG